MSDLYERYPMLEICRADIEAALSMLKELYKADGMLYACGNGGSAADCEHLVGELMKGFELPRKVTDERIEPEIREKLQGGLRALSLPSQVSILTATANDTDPRMVYAQLVYGYGRPGDALLGISTSGNSENVVLALKVAKSMGLKTIVLTGQGGGKAAGIADIAIRVPETVTNKVQELHLPIYHYLCQKLEKYFFG